MCEYPAYKNFGRSHKLSKRSIVRGIKFPDLTNECYKERPGLVINDVDSCPGYFGGTGVTLVPLTSLPYSHFDIPIFIQFVYGRERISYIATNSQSSFIFNERLRSTVTNCVTCPDVVFDLVIKVKSLQLNGTRESYEEAVKLVKEYRLEFMNTYGVKIIKYGIDTDIMYELHADGSEKYYTQKGAGTERDTIMEISSDNCQHMKTVSVDTERIVHTSQSTAINDDSCIEDDIMNETVYTDDDDSGFNTFTEALRRMNDTYSNERSVQKRKLTINSKSTPKVMTKLENREETKCSGTSRIRISKCTDQELLNFVKLIKHSKTCSEVSNALGISYSSTVNRFNQTMKELQRRGFADHVIEWPFARSLSK